MNKVKVVIIDSGISSNVNFVENIKKSYCLVKSREKFQIKECELNDLVGHGTAVSNIIYSQNSHIEIINFKICRDEIEIEEDGLCYILNYIYDNVEANIINISAGLTYLNNYDKLTKICDKLYRRGFLIISAFDNDGAISYPAAMKSVIGVDVNKQYVEKKEVCWIVDSIVDIEVADRFYRTIWMDKKEIIKGTSFACAYITGLISKYIEGNIRLKKEDILNLITTKQIKVRNNVLLKPDFRISKAILYHVNKESHALLRYKDLLYFNLVGVYDERLSGNVGKEFFGVVVKPIEEINWDEFDTIIVSCVAELSALLRNDCGSKIIQLAKIRNKKVYSFEKIFSTDSNYYYPEIIRDSVPYYNNQKMHKISLPVVGVFGTSSKQGKFSLQLSLKRELSKRGYSVGHISTEPSGYLFDSDYVFHFGYGAEIDLKSWEIISILNEMVWQTEIRKRDILITGCQSGTIHYDISKINDCAIYQYAFALGTLPDFIVLCVNPHDDTAYIKKTIDFINSIDVGKVCALVIFPMEAKETLAGIRFQIEEIDIHRMQVIKENWSESFGIPAYSLNSKNDVDKLCDNIINFFSE